MPEWSETIERERERRANRHVCSVLKLFNFAAKCRRHTENKNTINHMQCFMWYCIRCIYVDWKHKLSPTLEIMCFWRMTIFPISLSTSCLFQLFTHTRTYFRQKCGGSAILFEFLQHFIRLAGRYTSRPSYIFWRFGCWFIASMK